MKNKEFDSIFDNIDNSQFEEMLKECGFEYQKVEPGQGGLYINGIKVKKDFFYGDLYEKKYSKTSMYSCVNCRNDSQFDVSDDTNFAKAA